MSDNQLLISIRQKKTEVAFSLINSYKDFAFKDEYGQDALFYSVVYMEPKICQVLISKGVDINTTYKNKKSILHIAIESNLEEKGYYSIIESLVTSGVKIDQPDIHGNTPLWYACTYYIVNRKTIDLLLNNGSDVFKKNKYGSSVYSSAKDNDRKELLQILERFATGNGNVID